MTPEEKALVTQRYAAGILHEKIQQFFGVSAGVVQDIVQASGIKLRRTRKTPFELSEIAEHSKTHTQQETAKKFEVGRTTVVRARKIAKLGRKLHRIHDIHTLRKNAVTVLKEAGFSSGEMGRIFQLTTVRVYQIKKSMRNNG